ncbi:MAG: hypothetical protein Q8Q36_01870 [bacterium]|nr:hypothetical protein [bacterium]
MTGKNIIALALLLLVAGGFYFLFKSGLVRAPEALLNSYRNEAYGIEFTYPDGYVLDEKEVGNGERRHYNISLFEDTPFVRDLLAGKVLGTEAPPSISVDFYQNDLDNQALWAWIRGTNFSNWKLSDERYASTTIDGTEAVTYTWDGLYRGESVVFLHGGNVVMLSVTYHTPEDKLRSDFEETVAPSFKTF